MASNTGVLAMVADTALRDDVDRVAAAVGVRILHVGSAEPPSRRGFAAAAAVVLDEPAALRCAHAALPRRSRVILVCGSDPEPSTWEAAIAVGAQRVLTLPRQESELVAGLSDAGEPPHDDGTGGVIAVVGGRGGAGASTFAAALALTARSALIIDADPWSGGIDLMLGGEKQPGLRWPDLAVQAGRLSFAAVRDALPTLQGVTVLSGTRSAHEIDAAALSAVVDAGRRAGTAVVCDLPRRLTPAAETALDAADLVVLVTTCDVRGCAAAASMAPALAAINPNVGLVVRGPSPGGLRATEVARIAAVPLLAAMRPHPRLAETLEHRGLRVGRRSPLSAAARRVLTVLHRNPALEAA